MAAVDLARLEWLVAGWRPYQWLALGRIESGSFGNADVPPVPASVHSNTIDWPRMLPVWIGSAA